MILLIDADSLLYYSGFQDSESEAKESLTKRLVEMCQQHNTNRFIAFLTKGSFRYNVAQTKPYKGNRKNTEKPPHYDALRKYATETLRFEVVENIEADDLVVYWHYNLGEDNIICSPDKDVLYSVAGTHWNYKYFKNKDTNTVIKGSEVVVDTTTTMQFPYKQCIIGDSGDNIPGIKGLGTKKVDKLFEDCTTEDLCYKKCIDTFVEHYGIPQGFHIFLEMYRLVYILRSEEDITRELGFGLVKPAIRKINY